LFGVFSQCCAVKSKDQFAVRKHGVGGEAGGANALIREYAKSVVGPFRHAAVSMFSNRTFNPFSLLFCCSSRLCFARCHRSADFIFDN
jgi:hypothetical protein